MISWRLLVQAQTLGKPSVQNHGCHVNRALKWQAAGLCHVSQRKACLHEMATHVTVLFAHLYHSKPVASVSKHTSHLYSMYWSDFNTTKDCPCAHQLHAQTTDSGSVSEPDIIFNFVHQVKIPDPVVIVLLLLLLLLLLLGELVSPEVAVPVPDDVPSSVSTPSALVVEEEEPWLPALKEPVPWMPPLLPILASKRMSAAASILFVLIRPSHAFQ